MKPAVTAGVTALALALLAYPLMFHLLDGRLGLSWLALLFGLLVLGRIATLGRIPLRWRAAGAAGAACFLLAVTWYGSSALLKLYPVAVNAALLGFCVHTLYRPPSAVERLVRWLGMPVSEAGVGYTRNVTRLWCGFFALNGLAAGYTALLAPTAAWAWYNGVLSYLLGAALFGGEWLYRGFYRRRVHGSAGSGAPAP